MYPGEINDRQEGAWRKTLEVFDDERQGSRTLSLFPEDREIPADAVDCLRVKLSGPAASASASVRQLLAGMRSVVPTRTRQFLAGSAA